MHLDAVLWTVTQWRASVPLSGWVRAGLRKDERHYCCNVGYNITALYITARDGAAPETRDTKDQHGTQA